MVTCKKFMLIVLLLISYSLGAIAQMSYYYYKGNRIPLTVNDSKVCVSIPKSRDDISKEIHENFKELDRITDEDFDIFTLQLSDLKRLSASDSSIKETMPILFSPCYRTTEGTEVYLSPYLNVRLKEVQDINLLSSYAERYGLRIVKPVPFMPLWYILSVSSETEKNALEIANELWESGKFAAAVPDLCAGDLICSNDPMFNYQWGLYNSNYPGIDISVTPAWNYVTGKNVKIAILDSGVDLNHIDLASNISSISYDTETGSSPSVVYLNHGTHCAGIAAAVKDNGIQIAGVAPDATIVSISNKMIVSTDAPSKLASGIEWAYQHGVDIISNSWYYPTQHPIIDEAIHDAFTYGRHGKGCVIVFAAGNSNSSVEYPANCNDTVLAVGSINSAGTKASSSNYGPGLDVVAPGVSILSTLPNNAIGYDSGTSMACPHVAGVAALILEKNSELMVNQVNSIINSNAKKISGVNFNITNADGSWNNQYGYGLVDAYSSVINTPGSAYIQNETITGTRVVTADSIYVGKDVTNGKPFGDVILGQGDITLKAKYTKIKNSTTVPLGTTLKIGN